MVPKISLEIALGERKELSKRSRPVQKLHHGMVTRLPRRRRYTVGKLVFMAGIVTAVLFCTIIAVQFFQQARIRKDVQRFKLQLAQVEERNRSLHEEIDRLLSDPGYLEFLARKHLGLVKPDETVFRRQD